MSYCHINFLTKKSLREALTRGDQITVYQPGPFGPDVKDGICYLEGPHFPQPHKWYASAMVKDGIIIGKVK